MVLKFHEKETLFSEESKGSESPTDYLAEKETDDDEEEEYKIETIRRKDERKTTAIKIVKVSVDKLDLLLNNVGSSLSPTPFSTASTRDAQGQFRQSVTTIQNRMDQMSRIAKICRRDHEDENGASGQYSRVNRLVARPRQGVRGTGDAADKGRETELDKKVIDAIGER